jgi:hypothetical protein
MDVADLRVGDRDLLNAEEPAAQMKGMIIDMKRILAIFNRDAEICDDEKSDRNEQRPLRDHAGIDIPARIARQKLRYERVETAEIDLKREVRERDPQGDDPPTIFDEKI